MKKIVTKIELNHEDLVNFLSTATFGDYTFDVFLDDNCKKLYESLENKVGDCYEDKWADVLLNNGYLLIANNEELYDTKEEALNDDNSVNHKVYNVIEHVGFDGKIYYKPCYQITLSQIENCLCQICSNTMTGTYTDSLKDNFYNIFENNDGDFYDAWNIFQYIIFGDVVYG